MQGFLDVLQKDEEGIVRGIQAEEQELGRELVDARKYLERIEAQYAEPSGFQRFLKAIGLAK